MSPSHRAGTFCGRQVQSMAIRGGNTSSYDTQEQPFRPDNLRGRWAKSIDFYFASSTYAFSTMAFSDVSAWALIMGGWKVFFTSYLVAVCFYSLPIFIIQTFLGQFSSSGAISAFRVSPIFKGVGYSILVLNVGTLIYYSVNAAVPLIYAVYSLSPVMPWMSCDNSWNSQNCSTHEFYDENVTNPDPHSTQEFFHHVIGSRSENSNSLTASWYMGLAVLIIWVSLFLLMLNRVSIIGKTLRCTCVLIFGSFLSVFIYTMIHEEIGWQNFMDYLNPIFVDWKHIRSVMAIGILQASMILGPGWGSIITLGSYNSFRSDAERLSIWVCITHVLVTLMTIICCNVANDHFEDHVGMEHVPIDHSLQFLFLTFGYLFGRFTTLPHLWSFLFFTVVFLAEMCALTTLLLSVLTSLFDEFEQLRPNKQMFKFLFILTLLGSSLYFCTQLGFSQVSSLAYTTVFTQIIISALLILMATWIYGRARFQCDLQFMLGKTISSIKIFTIRFITPLFLVIFVWEVHYILIDYHASGTLVWISQGCIYVLGVGYMIYKICQTNGAWRVRVKQCFAPHDWHPVNADNWRFYDEIMGTSEMLVMDNPNAA